MSAEERSLIKKERRGEALKRVQMARGRLNSIDLKKHYSFS
jgi:hypothetical protein